MMKPSYSYVLLVVCLALCPAKGQETSECIEEGKDIVFDDLKSGLESGDLVLVDVRSRAEIKKNGAIPKAHNIPLSELEEGFGLSGVEFLRKFGFKKPNPTLGNLVISCQGGARALHGWKLLNQFGYCDARVYFGSFQDWVNNDGLVVRSS